MNDYIGNSATASHRPPSNVSIARALRLSVHYTMKVGLYFAATILFLGVGEFAQLVCTSNDLREEAILDWRASHPDQLKLADTFVEQCLHNNHIKEIDTQNITKPVLISDCGKTMGAGELVQKMLESSLPLKTAAWPLSYLNPQTDSPE